MHKAAILTALFSLTLWAQSEPLAPGRLEFLDLHNGDLAQKGGSVAVAVQRSADLPEIAGVEFLFTPELTGRTISLGIDRDGTVESSGPDCEPNDCIARGIYRLKFDNTLPSPFDGWGRLGVRILGHAEEDAFIRVYWSSQPVQAAFTQPQFMQTPGAGGTFTVTAVSQADNIASIKVGWKLVVPVSRHINQFEQHVLGAELTHNGSASCLPTSIGANIAWLHDTGQWQDIPATITAGCPNNRDECLVTLLGTLMGTGSVPYGTPPPNGISGLVEYLQLMGYSRNVSYFIGDVAHVADPANGVYGLHPELLIGHFALGDIMTVGVHNVPGDQNLANPAHPNLGHFMAVDNISLNNDGSANLTFMDPFTVNNPTGKGIYRVTRMHPDGRFDWSNTIPAFNYPFFSPASGQAVAGQLQWLGFSSFSSLVDAVNTLNNTASDSVSAPPTSGELPGQLQRDGHVWTGTFTPPPASPGPWILVSEVTLKSGHKERAFRYVVRDRATGK